MLGSWVTDECAKPPEATEWLRRDSGSMWQFLAACPPTSKVVPALATPLANTELAGR
jgi:hypothetical protein